jgi:hypothetical protein
MGSPEWTQAWDSANKRNKIQKKLASNATSEVSVRQASTSRVPYASSCQHCQHQQHCCGGAGGGAGRQRVTSNTCRLL